MGYDPGVFQVWELPDGFVRGGRLQNVLDDETGICQRVEPPAECPVELRDTELPQLVLQLGRCEVEDPLLDMRVRLPEIAGDFHSDVLPIGVIHPLPARYVKAWVGHGELQEAAGFDDAVRLSYCAIGLRDIHQGHRGGDKIE